MNCYSTATHTCLLLHCEAPHAAFDRSCLKSLSIYNQTSLETKLSFEKKKKNPSKQ